MRRQKANITWVVLRLYLFERLERQEKCREKGDLIFKYIYIHERERVGGLLFWIWLLFRSCSPISPTADVKWREVLTLGVGLGYWNPFTDGPCLKNPAIPKTLSFYIDPPPGLIVCSIKHMICERAREMEFTFNYHVYRLSRWLSWVYIQWTLYPIAQM